jgi:type IV pilus assembly protein PilY1
MNRLYILFGAFVFTLLAGLSTTLTADDTEIYLRQVPSTDKIEGKPSILFVLDRTGSMMFRDRDASGRLLYNGTTRLERLQAALLQMLAEIQDVNVGFMGFNGYAFDKNADGNAQVLFPVSFIDEDAKNVPGEMDDAARLSIPIANYSDDAEEGLSSGKVYLDDKIVELVYSGETEASLTTSSATNYNNTYLEYKAAGRGIPPAIDQAVVGTIERSTHRYFLGNSPAIDPVAPIYTGLRFLNMEIPQGANIRSATVSFMPSSSGVSASNNRPLQLKISVADSDNAPELNHDGAAVSVDWGSAGDSISWDPGQWTEFKFYKTPNLASLIQDIVNRGGWESGNSIGLIFELEGDSKNWRFFNHTDVGITPTLDVSYTLEGGGVVVNSSVDGPNSNAFIYKEKLWSSKKTLTDGQNPDLKPDSANVGLYLGRALNPTVEGIVGLRFGGIRIPRNVVIRSALIEMIRLDGNNTTTDVKLKIYGQNSGDSLPFTSANNVTDFEGRDKTTANVKWDVPNVGIGRALVTPNLKDVVQEIVDRPDWSESNALTFFLESDFDETPTSSNRRKIATYSGDGDQSSAAVLKILYEEVKDEEEEEVEPRVPELQQVGFRFQNVGIPQGATIRRARIDFTSGFATDDPAVIDIHGEASGNAEEFSNSEPISKRSRTNSRIRWDADAWEWTDKVYPGPDMTSVVQEIVNRSDWCGNNSMAFIMSAPDGQPLRNVVAYDADPEKAAVFQVEYDPTTVSPNACMRYMFTRQVNDANDDMEETKSDGIVYPDSRTLDMTTTSGGNARIVGLRFNNIPMAAGTEVLQARLIFTAVEDATSGSDNAASLARAASLKIYGEAAANSEPFSADIRGLTSRPKTSKEVAWSIEAADRWHTGRRYTSVDIAPVIQEIVNQGGWQSGNALSLFVDGTGLRQAAAFERALTDAPMLQIEVRGSLNQAASKVRDRLQHMVENIVVDSTTPLVDAIYEVAMYLTGGPVRFGKDRRNYRTKRVSHPGSWKGGELIRPDGCGGSNPWDGACRGEKITGNAVYTPPEITDECQKTYVIFLTDGGANTNSAIDFIPDLVGGACRTNRYDGEPYAYRMTKSDGTLDSRVNNFEVCGTDVVEFLHEKVDLDPNLEGSQNIILHTIGFNISGPFYLADGSIDMFESNLNARAVPYMRDWAKAGGGNFYEAADSADLLEIFRTIISSAMTESTSFAAPSLSVNTFNRMYHRNEVYFSLFKPTHNQRWDGNVKKYTVCTTGNCKVGDILGSNGLSAVAGKYISESARSFWSSETDGADVLLGGAGERLQRNAISARNLYTYIGSSTPGINHNIDLSAIKVSTEIISPELLGVTTEEERDKIVNWIRGVDVMGEYGPPGGKRWLMSDPLHSSPVTITYGGTNTRPISKVFVGTNDGLVRMLDASTGNEEWAFLPQELFEIQQGLMINAKGPRIYGIDGTPTFRVRDSNNNGQVDGDDFVHMFIGMRRGGRNLYALDVTNSSKPKLMWTITGGQDAGYENLGQTWSRPKLARILYRGVPKTVLIFGGGYHGDDESSGAGRMGNGIYIVDPDNGRPLWVASDSTQSSLVLPRMIYPIPSDMTLVDSDADAIIDRLYVGDIAGQLWRIDLPKNLGVEKGIGGRLAMVSDADSRDPQVMHRRRFFYPPEVVRLSDATYSATSDYFAVAITSGTRPSPLSTSTHDRFYLFRDRAVDGLIDDGTGRAREDRRRATPTTFFYTLGEQDLYDATPNLIQESDGGKVQIEVDKMRESMGWYLCLTENSVCDDSAASFGDGDNEASAWIGEKGLASPIILDGKVFFTTYLPTSDTETDPSDICNVIVPEGQSRMYALDLLTGGAAYDFDKTNNDGENDLKSSDRYMSLRDGITSDISAMLLENGEFRLLTNDLSTLRNAPSIRSDLQPTFWAQE